VSQQGIFVTTSVVCETEEQAVRAMEKLSRVALGLAFDGQSMSINATPYELDDEDDDD
jgi:hypothetical protein